MGDPHHVSAPTPTPSSSKHARVGGPGVDPTQAGQREPPSKTHREALGRFWSLPADPRQEGLADPPPTTGSMSPEPASPAPPSGQAIGRLRHANPTQRIPQGGGPGVRPGTGTPPPPARPRTPGTPLEGEAPSFLQGPPRQGSPTRAERPRGPAGHAPGDLGQDLLDAHDELLVLGGVALDGAVQPGHVEVQRAERGRLARACGGGTVSAARRESPRSGRHRDRGQRKSGVLGRGPLARVRRVGWGVGAGLHPGK